MKGGASEHGLYSFQSPMQMNKQRELKVCFSPVVVVMFRPQHGEPLLLVHGGEPV